MSVIVASSLNAALAAKAATTTIPIVFDAGGDPVATGLIASLNRPGGNVTGISSMGAELDTKRLGLLHDLVPAAKRVAVLVDPITTFAKPTVAEVQAAAAGIGAEVDAFTAGPAETSMRRLRASCNGALMHLWSRLLLYLKAAGFN